MARRTLAVFLLVALSLQGCREKPAEWGEACSKDGQDCADGLHCYLGWLSMSSNGVCLDNCQTQADCRPLPPAGAFCQEPTDGGVYGDLGGYCMLTCETNSDCPQEEVKMECRLFDMGLSVCTAID